MQQDKDSIQVEGKIDKQENERSRMERFENLIQKMRLEQEEYYSNASHEEMEE
jgi:hypothetical protein